MQALISWSGEVYLQTDAALRITWASETAGARFAWSSTSVVGTSLLDLIHPDDHPAWQEGSAETVVQSLPRGSHRARVRAGDGRWRWIRLAVAPLTQPDGSLVGAFAALLDVDDVVRAEVGLAEQEELLQSTLDAELDPHVRLVPVRNAGGSIVDFTYAQANRAACEYNGLPRERLVGMRLLELLPGHVGTGLLEQYARVVDTGEPLILDDFSYEAEVRDGQQRFFDIRAVRVGDGLSYMWRDVTDRHEAEEELAAEREQFRSAMDAASIGMCLIGPDGAFLKVNPALCQLLGRDEPTLLAATWQELTHPDDLDVDLSLVDDVLSGRRDSYRLRKRYLRPDGSIVWGELAVSCVRERDGRVRHFVSQIVDMTIEHEQQQELLRRATTDALTGLLNRAEILHRLGAMLEHPPRTGSALGVAFLDLDSMKRVNDERGHDAGDRLLDGTAGRVRAGVREGDLVARIGGDELLVLLPGVHDVDEAVAVAEKIRAAVAAPITIGEGGPIVTTASIGVTLARPGETVDHVVNRADQAMYQAKRDGGDRVAAWI